MRWSPKPHQLQIVDHILKTQRANVWVDMSAGKTSAVLTALELLWLAGSQAHPALVVAPLRVARDTWPQEVAKWDHLRRLKIVHLHGTPKQRSALLSEPADLYTTSYESLPRLQRLLPGNVAPWRVVIADESRKLRGMRVRQGAVRARALFAITKQAVRWINMTGTPAPEGLLDLWGAQYFLDRGKALKPTYTEYKKQYFEQDAHSSRYLLRPGVLPVIQKRLAPSTISLRNKDWMPDLYEADIRKVPVTLPPQARAIYQRLEKQLFVELDSGATLTASSAGALHQKCWQCANGAIYTTQLQEGESRINRPWEKIHDAKLIALKELVDELDGQPLLVVYHFLVDQLRLQQYFPELVVYESTEHGARWNAGEIPLMALHPGRGGHGLNLQDGGCHMAFFSQVYSLEHRLQVIERIGPARQIQSGHPRPVIVWDLIAEDTVDETMAYRLRTKASQQDALRQYRKARQ